MLVTRQQTRHGVAAFPRQQYRCSSTFPMRSSRRSAAHGAVEVVGETYEDIVDQLARRVLTRRLTNGTATTSSTTSSTTGGAPAVRSRRVVVGIAGAPGSGKTTLAAAVAARVNELVDGGAERDAEAERGQGQGREAAGARSGAPLSAVMPMDGFHYYRRELDAMPDPREAHARRGAPWTFNAAKFVECVRQVRLAGAGAGAAAVRLPSFDHGVGDPVEEDIEVAAETEVVLVEGNYLLLDEEPWRQLRSLFDETWFVSAPLDLIQRRLFDRQTGIGLAPEISLERIRTNDLPNAELVAGSAGAAQVVVPGWVPPRGSSGNGPVGQAQAQAAAAPAAASSA